MVGRLLMAKISKEIRHPLAMTEDISIQRLVDPPTGPRRHLKRAFVTNTVMNAISYGMSTIDDLDVVEYLILAFVAGRASQGMHTTTTHLPEFLNISPATTSRRMSRLIELGYIKRFRQGRAFCYVPTEDIHNARYVRSDGIDILDAVIGEMRDGLRKVDGYED